MTNNTPRPLGVLDEFKSAGIFVNWWQQIRYDLKTIISTGWHHTLIPDAYLIVAFFQAQADAIEALEPKDQRDPERVGGSRGNRARCRRQRTDITASHGTLGGLSGKASPK
jgi:hypothetical protein